MCKHLYGCYDNAENTPGAILATKSQHEHYIDIKSKYYKTFKFCPRCGTSLQPKAILPKKLKTLLALGKKEVV